MCCHSETVWRQASYTIRLSLHKIHSPFPQSNTKKETANKENKKKPNKPNHCLPQGGKTVRRLHQRKDWRWDMRNSEQDKTGRLASPVWLFDRRRGKSGGHRTEWKREKRRQGVEETAEKGEVVPVWREKALCSLSVDRPVRRAQGRRPEGFTGLCSFLCGSSVSTTATTDPPSPAWCSLQVHHWLQSMTGPPLPTLL